MRTILVVLGAVILIAMVGFICSQQVAVMNTVQERAGNVWAALNGEPGAVDTEPNASVDGGGIQGDWRIQYFPGAPAEMKAWTFNDLAPRDWPEFPDVDNTALGIPASQGLEYGEDLNTFCQYKETCDFVVPARHYRLYSGDYTLEGVGECKADASGKGCALMVVNVGEVTASFEDQTFDAGFTVMGRYWDGGYVAQAIWGGLSHFSSNMLNLDSNLNPSPITNAGANCSVPSGCSAVEATFVVTSGNEILMIGRSVVRR